MAKRLSGNFTESENFGTSFDTADRNSGNKSRSNGNARRKLRASVLAAVGAALVSLTACGEVVDSAQDVASAADHSTRSTGAAEMGESGIATQAPSSNVADALDASAIGGNRDAQRSVASTPLNQNDNSQRQIMHSSEGWEFLENVGSIMPGGKYSVLHGDGTTSECSFGWWVFNEAEPNRHYMATAGHCGDEGDLVYIEDSEGETYQVGEFVWSQFDNVVAGVDHALIELTVNPEFVTGTPPIEGVQVVGSADLDWLTATQPMICRLGYRTGISCGQFRSVESGVAFSYDGIVDHGDSGGAIWAVDPSDSTKIYAVGITAYMFTEDATNSGATALQPLLAQFGLTVVG